MSSDALIGNAGAIERLRAATRRGRLAHAYLFAGPSGVGKRTTALAFAKSLLCPARSWGDGCPDCARVDKETHQQLTVVRYEESREITITQMREVVRQLTMRSPDPRHRIVIIDEADRLNDESANCVLKTLEEPPARCILILVTAKPPMILPTILSRCQTILFMPLPEEEITRFGHDRLKLDAVSAALVARLANGSPGHATALAADVDALKARASSLLESVATGDLGTVLEGITRARDTAQARDRAREQLTLLAFSLREVLRARTTGARPDPALAPEALVRRLANVEPEDLADRILAVLDRIRMIDLFANVSLAVEDALLQV